MKVTIISLDNWGFNSYISDALIKKGIKTTSINFNDFKYEYPTLFHRILNFFLKNLINYNLKSVHLKKQIGSKLESLPKQDKILIIKSDFLNRKTLQLIQSKTDELITFLNDSISRYPKVKTNLDLFDKIYSFEKEDCLKYGFIKINNFIYTKIYENNSLSEEYSIFNISSIDKRKESVQKFADYFNKNNISFKIILNAENNCKKLEQIGITITDEIYSIPEMLECLKKCKIILDLQRPKQNGLSFRVFESLAFKKKLITLNKDIINYDFYDPNNILLINDINNIEIPDLFLKSKYVDIDDSILEKYHISNWINVVFDL